MAVESPNPYHNFFDPTITSIGKTTPKALDLTGIRPPHSSNGDLSVTNGSAFQGVCEFSGASGAINTFKETLMSPNFKSLGDVEYKSN